MNEVSCRVLEVFYRRLKQEGRPVELLIAGAPYSAEHLRDRNAWMDWSALVHILANARRLWTEDQLVEIGGSFLLGPLLLPVGAIARLLFTPAEFYRWANDPKKGLGNQMFRCIEPTLRQIAPNRIRTELRLMDGYAYSREFFLVTKGGLESCPRILGFRDPAKIEMTPTERGAIYDITFPVGGGLVSRAVRSLGRPFAARTVARELNEANLLLLARFEELEAARAVLAQQKTHLETAHEIGQVIHKGLDIDRTIDAVASALVEVGGFIAARVAVASELDGVRIDRHAAAGQADPVGEAIEVALEGRAGRIGGLTLWIPPAADRAAQTELLRYVASAVSVTIDDAIAFTALSDYRQTLEDKVADRTRDLVAAHDALAEAHDRLTEAQRTRDRIFANINHEIRTPLSLIVLAAGSLRERLTAMRDRALVNELATIDASVRRLLKLVDDLLMLAASEEGKLAVAPRPCDVAVLIGAAVTAFEPAARAAGLALAYHGPSALPLAIDDSAIERIMANLLSNAIKFTPDGGRIDVELADQHDRAMLIVRDTGIGIDAEFRGRIFGRFEQGKPSVRRGVTGSGLGLALVKELVQAHGGTIEVDSPPGSGTLFRVCLPRRAAVAPASGRDTGVDRRTLSPADFGLGRPAESGEILAPPPDPDATVLVAEDDVGLATALYQLLGRQYRVLVAHDGEAALRLAVAHAPDALITDIGMPEMDGLELARRFRDLPGNRLAPILVLSAFTEAGDRLAGFQAGAIDYIAKPFEPRELLARLRSQLAVRALALRMHQSEQLAALGTLSTGLAHELRNPINAIVNAIVPLRRMLPAEVLAGDTATGQLFEVLEQCTTEVARLARQLLGFSRSGALDHQPVALEVLLDRALTLVGGSLGGIEIRRALGHAGEIDCAGPLIVQILANLLGNAAQAAGPGGWIEIASHLRGERVVVEVRDSGPGVPIELRERIFEPFFTTKPPGVGTGLGLHTARQLAAQHGGSLDARDGAAGTVFHLELPIAQPSAIGEQVSRAAGA